MHGFRVSLADGTDQVVEADRYVVGNNGDLELHGGAHLIATFEFGSWFSVTEIGRQLSEEWPYPNMQNVIGAAVHQMAKYGYIPSGQLPEPKDWRINDFDSLVAAIVGADGIDIDTSDRMEREMVHLVREVVAKEFSIRWQRPKPT